MRYLVLAICLLSVTACDLFGPSSPSPVNAQFTLAPGQTETIVGASTRVTFVSVTSDSRCPANALCIVAGEAVVRIDVWTDGRSSTHQLRTGNVAPAKADDLTIELVEVAPYPFSTAPIDPASYRVTLRVKR
jgi:hypothetical protein